MSDIAVRVENLGKRYRIDRARQRHDTLRDALTAGLRAPLGWLRTDGHRRPPAGEDTIWALKDVSFEVRRGEVVGIIGANGAGKSTLLKILSRITPPTEGRAEIHGRVGSLLEVGTGFHPELSGRENVYLSGAVLGMRRAEIDRLFDQIVAFAEVERFIDTPIKRYSSGMQVRLGFAVAAHLQPEVLLVDEVLAVGDAAFQKKCLGRLLEIGNTGRSVLLVSHNLVTISALCSRAFLLENGRIVSQGRTNTVTADYEKRLCFGSSGKYLRSRGPPDSEAWIHSAELQSPEHGPSASFSMTDTIDVVISICFRKKCKGLRLAVRICEENGMPVSQIMNVDSGFDISSDEGQLAIRVRTHHLMLYPNDYLLTITLADSRNHPIDIAEGILRFKMIQDSRICRRNLPRSSGLVFYSADWQVVERRRPSHSCDYTRLPCQLP
jgi:lipopolysaccharide transport system ATP-binding protein